MGSRYICTGCDYKALGEYAHDILNVPLCGDCNNRYRMADFKHDSQYCSWCGKGDESIELFLCDTCPASFCTHCITRNFSIKESSRVRQTDPWSCYICIPTESILKLKISGDYQFFNIDAAYDRILPPKESIHQSLVSEVNLSKSESCFVSFFESYIFSKQYHANLPSRFLTAKDIFSVLYRISKNIRNYFMFHLLYPAPGLFQTDYGIENSCKLYKHQLISLQRMFYMENCDTRFNVLRGGILADEPGTYVLIFTYVASIA